jgi:hypothetical protein
VSRSDNPFRRGLSRRLVRAAKDPGAEPDLLLGDLLLRLGDRSFGWCIVLFALASLLPLPPGATLVTAVPLALLAGQMALGLPRVRLPDVIARRPLPRRTIQRAVLWLGPLMRPIERLVRPRYPALFTPPVERAAGALLVVVAMALAVPIPVSSYLPAIALLLSGIGLVERDGLALLAGLALGIVAIIVTLAVGGAVVLGARAALPG